MGRVCNPGVDLMRMILKCHHASQMKCKYLMVLVDKYYSTAPRLEVDRSVDQQQL